ncbi:MAG: helix-turn-helix domain-containing protein [Tannerella sp.]|nr:helix-turn-helix domain-containing protein [Tannerella sp.]
MKITDDTPGQATECQEQKPGRHLGLNVRHLREMLCIKQQTLADKMGISQQTISNIENKAYLDKKTLEKIALALEIPVALIENLNLDEVIYNIQNNYDAENAFQMKSQNNNTTNSLDILKYTIQQHQKLYEKRITVKI